MKVIATGGHAKVISGFSWSIKYIDPHLTLHGLRIISEN
jgi:pantothenate kinase type III